MGKRPVDSTNGRLPTWDNHTSDEDAAGVDERPMKKKRQKKTEKRAKEQKRMEYMNIPAGTLYAKMMKEMDIITGVLCSCDRFQDNIAQKVKTAAASVRAGLHVMAERSRDTDFDNSETYSKNLKEENEWLKMSVANLEAEIAELRERVAASVSMRTETVGQWTSNAGVPRSIETKALTTDILWRNEEGRPQNQEVKSFPLNVDGNRMYQGNQAERPNEMQPEEAACSKVTKQTTRKKTMAEVVKESLQGENKVSSTLDVKARKIKRPTKNAIIKITHLADFVKKERIVRAVAKVGQCNKREVNVISTVQSKTAMGIAWVRCPIGSAKKITAKETLNVGWCVAKTELQKERAKRCYRCLREGHIGVQCPSGSKETRCFQCGQPGHVASVCKRRPYCELCDQKGLSSMHRVGSVICRHNEELLNKGDEPGPSGNTYGYSGGRY